MFHRKPNRLAGYNYSRDNLYFITSCVKDRVCCFGKIETVGKGRDLSLQSESKMILNQYGRIANDQWYWLAQQYPYVVLHEFVVMPNHIHGIIEINRENILAPHGDTHIEGTGRDVGTGRDLSLQRQPSSNPEIKIKSLSELMGAYKTTTSKQIHLAGFHEFEWQRSFHDRIIRDEESYRRISEYIINNPSAWQEDEFY